MAAGVRTGRGGRTFTSASIAPNGTVGALWLLVALELLAQVGLRRYYRKNHGG